MAVFSRKILVAGLVALTHSAIPRADLFARPHPHVHKPKPANAAAIAAQRAAQLKRIIQKQLGERERLLHQRRLAAIRASGDRLRRYLGWANNRRWQVGQEVISQLGAWVPWVAGVAIPAMLDESVDTDEDTPLPAAAPPAMPAKAIPRSGGIDPEKAARSKLDFARSLAADGKYVRAQEYCAEITRDYPGTRAAAEAKRLREPSTKSL